jgi:hypothetical protein
VTAYNDLNGFQFRTGKGYEKRSVEQFKAISLSAVDELLREVTQLRDEMAGAGQPSAHVPGDPALSPEEVSLITRFRSATSDVRQLMLVGQPPVAPPEPPAFGTLAAMPPVFPSETAQPPFASEPAAVAFGGQPDGATETDWAAAAAPVSPEVAELPPASEFGFGAPDVHLGATDFLSPGGADEPTAEEPEWLRSLNDEPSAPVSSNWFLDDAFEGAVPPEARQPLAAATETAPPPPPPPTATPDPWEAPPAVWGAPPSTVAFAEPAPAHAFEPAAFAPAAPFERAVFEPAGLAPGAFAPAPSFEAAPVPMLESSDSGRQIDDLFNQLDFGPPPAGVLAIAGTVAHSTGAEIEPFAPASPLHVDRPTENPGPLPAPTPPWSGWIQS